MAVTIVLFLNRKRSANQTGFETDKFYLALLWLLSLAREGFFACRKDYETLDLHWRETGIVGILRHIPLALLIHGILAIFKAFAGNLEIIS
jgi:hypothetical protein